MKIVLNEKVKIKSDLRINKKFIIIPRIIKGTFIWLETAYLIQEYKYYADFIKWKTVGLADSFEFIKYKESENNNG